MILRPGPSHDDFLVRLFIEEEATLLVVADFAAVGETPDRSDVSFVVNGHRLWRPVADRRLILPVTVPKNSSLDFCVRAKPGADPGECAVWLRFALFRKTGKSSQMTRDFDYVDDGIGSLDPATAWGWVTEACAPDSGDESWFDRMAGRYLLPHDRAEIEYGFGRTLSQLAADLRNGPAEDAGKRFALYFIPRSGSTALCEMMSRCRTFGHPHEYLDGRILGFFSAVLGAPVEQSPSLAYLDLISSRCQSSNGVFGFEVEFDRLRAQGPGFADYIENWPALYLVRRDVLAQAISLFFASQGNLWSNFANGTRDIPYDRGRILDYLSALLRQMQGFETLFADRSIRPLRLYYESLLDDTAGVMRQIAAHIGVEVSDLDECDLRALNWQVTRRAVNDEYALRILSEGGDVFGFTFFDEAGSVTAVLAGLDISEIPDFARLPPLFFRGPTRDAVLRLMEEAIEGISARLGARSPNNP